MNRSDPIGNENPLIINRKKKKQKKNVIKNIDDKSLKLNK